MVLTYTYDAADRMPAVGGQSVTWDNNGNMLRKDGVTYVYDSSSRLTRVVSATLVATYEYNSAGLRTAMSTNGVRTSYLWDVAAGLPVILTDTNSVYVYGLSLIARQTGSEVEYYHIDDLLSVRNLTNGAGQNTGTYAYGAFGDLRFSSATSANRFRYTGQLNDPETGLYYLRARYYEPGTGRFPSRDPLQGSVALPQSLNAYVYVVNNPLRYEDPSGLQLVVPVPLPPPYWGPVGIGGAGGSLYRRPEQFPEIDPSNFLNLDWTRMFDLAKMRSRWDWLLGPAGTQLGYCETWHQAISLTWEQFAADEGDWEEDEYAKKYGDAYVPKARDKTTDQAKSTEQKRSEDEVWKEVTKGLTAAEAKRLHERLKALKGEARNADPQEMIEERNSMFPDKPYPGGWLQR